MFDTETLEIVLNGAETRVFDKTGNTEYTFTTTRTLRSTPLTIEERQARAIGTVSADTSSVKITIAGGLIIIHDKTAEQTYYIEH